jgi:hypothetical protein
MKKIFYTGLMILALLSGCKEDEPDYAELIVGKWLYTHVNGQPALTNESSYCEYRADGSEVYATGFQLDENNKTWIESDHFSYQVTGNILSIEGTDANGKQNEIEIEIESIDENQTTQTTRKYLIDNTNYPDANTYTYKLITSDFSNQFVGCWYGKCTTPGTSDTSYHYWEYFSDGTYNYYFQDDQGLWIKKSDNEGLYFLYGNLFVSNYSNDLVTGGKGKTFECWNFNIDGNNMTWSALRNNNLTESYQMTKVTNPPKTD